jgi:hypothetical protein
MALLNKPESETRLSEIGSTTNGPMGRDGGKIPVKTWQWIPLIIEPDTLSDIRTMADTDAQSSVLSPSAPSVLKASQSDIRARPH